MQQILIKLWDDREFADHGTYVESQGAHFLELDGRRVRQDLTAENYRRLRSEVLPWLRAGHSEDERPSARAGFRLGSSESKQFYKDLRKWADSEGRSAEYQIRHRDGQISANNYKYKENLVRDYEAYLLTQAKAA